MNKSKLIFSILICIFFAQSAFAFGRKKPKPTPPIEAPIDGRRVIEFKAVENVTIELPDGTFHDFGENFKSKLSTRMYDNGRFLVAGAPPVEIQKINKIQSSVPDFVWSGSFTRAAQIQIKVSEMSFVTGSRGERVFYGFDSRLKNEFNNGIHKNEFPLKDLELNPNWFDQTFEVLGTHPFDSVSGLDLGDGLKIDLLFAWLAVKYARYRVQLNLVLEVKSPQISKFETKKIQVKGDGFFYDVAGGYQGYSAGIKFARKDAMLKAFDSAINATYAAIESSLLDVPILAKVDHVITDQEQSWILMGTGHGSDILPGVQFEHLGVPQVEIEVVSSPHSGSVAKLISGKIGDITLGMEFIQKGYKNKIQNFLGDVKAQEIEIPPQDIPLPDFGSGQVPSVSRWQAFLRSLVETVFLPYRIWRYFKYDQDYDSIVGAKVATFEENVKMPPGIVEPEEEKIIERKISWEEELSQEEWMPPLLGQKSLNSVSPVIAVIDTGVDYNHPVVRDHIWINPTPIRDTRGFFDLYGWDYISGDSRPYDDQYHGTEVASLILGVNPQAQILPLKIFNPWGVTSSASILAAFQYAIDHGAHVIVCAWSTRVASKALEKAIELANQHHKIVITAAGDLNLNLDQTPSYPASFSKKYDNLLVVGGMSAAHQKAVKSNYSPKVVDVLAPAENILAAHPRGKYMRVSHSGVAAAVVAGILSVQNSTEYLEEGDILGIKANFEEATVKDENLLKYSREGRRLKR